MTPTQATKTRVTTPLRNALKHTLFPQWERAGFVMDTSLQPQFTVFRRQTGHVIQIFNIQWDKRGQARFVINFGHSPMGSEECNGHPLLRLQRQRGRTLACWFQLRRPMLAQLISLRREYTPDEVVAQVMAVFPEVEHWWATGDIGAHVYGLRT